MRVQSCISKPKRRRRVRARNRLARIENAIRILTNNPNLTITTSVKENIEPSSHNQNADINNISAPVHHQALYTIKSESPVKTLDVSDLVSLSINLDREDLPVETIPTQPAPTPPNSSQPATPLQPVDFELNHLELENIDNLDQVNFDQLVDAILNEFYTINFDYFN